MMGCDVSIPSCRGKFFTFGLACAVVGTFIVSIPSCRGKFFTRDASRGNLQTRSVSIPSCRGKFFTIRTPPACARSPLCFNPLVSGQVLHQGMLFKDNDRITSFNPLVSGQVLHPQATC